MPKQEQLQERPKNVEYPTGDVKFGHYGRYVESMIKKCSALEEGEEKKWFTQSIANLMKQNALNWNRNTVTIRSPNAESRAFTNLVEAGQNPQR